MNQRVTREDDGATSTLTLCRPEKLNALDGLAFEELDSHLASLEGCADRIGCVVLRGEGRAFCAGADLQAMVDGPVAPVSKAGVIARLAALPQATVAAIHGVCYTGGLELALGCDFILADRSARFADTHGKWGLVAGWGLVQRLPRRIGQQAALRMMMTSRVVDAEEAQRIGLVDLLAGPEGLATLLATFTGELLANSWHTNRSVKRLLRQTDGMSLEQSLAYVQEHPPGFAPDYRERVASFRRK